MEASHGSCLPRGGAELVSHTVTHLMILNPTLQQSYRTKLFLPWFDLPRTDSCRALLPHAVCLLHSNPRDIEKPPRCDVVTAGSSDTFQEPVTTLGCGYRTLCIDPLDATRNEREVQRADSDAAFHLSNHRPNLGTWPDMLCCMRVSIGNRASDRGERAGGVGCWVLGVRCTELLGGDAGRRYGGMQNRYTPCLPGLRVCWQIIPSSTPNAPLPGYLNVLPPPPTSHPAG